MSYPLTDSELDRFNELYDKAVSRYLDKTDFDAIEWLNPEEANELDSLIRKEQGE